MHEQPFSGGPTVESAELIWRDGVPESARFGDVYFSRDNGLEETRYVFVGHNRLAERFAKIPDGGHFVVAETGFGTGLNFLATWQLWQRQNTSESAVLHFVSVERYPLTREDLARALALWPELSGLAEQLLENYPPLTQGAHRLVLAGGRVRLTLYFGDVLDAWHALDFTADAWFLDGFAPACNPDMWLDDAIAQIAQHSRPGTTVATFTAVGRVRRALEQHGFSMRKAAGFGRKRDMLVGELAGLEAASTKRTGPVAVIGAGIAGCLTARNLAERGVPVILIDSADRAGTAASGNLQGALYVKLGVEFNAQTQFALSALTFSQRYYQPYTGRFWHPTGLLQLAWNEQEQSRQQRFLARNRYPVEIFQSVDAETASELAGVTTDKGGLWFPDSGWLEPGALCRAIVNHPLIETRFGFHADRLMPCNGNWHISGCDGADIAADSLVIAAGHRSPELIPIRGDYRFKAIRGQVTHLPDALVHSPKAVICGQKYLNPSNGQVAVTGATFDLNDQHPDVTPTGHQENLSQLAEMLPGLVDLAQIAPEAVEGRVGFRCTTHDYQPVAGSLTDGLNRPVEGVYLLTGLGSKGLTYAPLLAEYLADRITGQPLSLPRAIQTRLNPGRMHKTTAHSATKNTEVSVETAVK